MWRLQRCLSGGRYRGVMNAFLTGLEQAREGGKDLSQIHSVASSSMLRGCGAHP